MNTDGSADFGYYQRVLRHGWRAILVLTLLGLVAGGALALTSARSYASTASILVTTTGVQETEAVGARTLGGTVNLDTEAQILTSSEVVGRVIEATGESFDARTVAEAVTASVPPNTTVLDITFTASSPGRARLGAEAFATAYLANRADAATASLQRQAETAQTQIDAAQARFDALVAAGSDPDTGVPAQVGSQISELASVLVSINSIVVTPGRVIDAPDTPTGPVSPDLVLLLASGAALGLLLGLVVSMYVQRVRPVLRDAGDVERELDLPVLADVRGAPGRLSSIAVPGSVEAAAFASLHRNLMSLGVRRVIVAPVSSQPAATLVAFNLAWHYARNGVAARLVLEDGERPGTQGRVEPDDGGGRLELVAGTEDTALTRFVGVGVRAVSAPLEVINLAGSLDDLARLDDVVDRVTVICVRTPSLLLPYLSSTGDAAVLVAARGKDRASAARAVRTAVESSLAGVVGVVLHPHHRLRKVGPGVLPAPPARPDDDPASARGGKRDAAPEPLRQPETTEAAEQPEQPEPEVTAAAVAPRALSDVARQRRGSTRPRRRTVTTSQPLGAARRTPGGTTPVASRLEAATDHVGAPDDHEDVPTAPIPTSAHPTKQTVPTRSQKSGRR